MRTRRSHRKKSAISAGLSTMMRNVSPPAPISTRDDAGDPERIEITGRIVEKISLLISVRGSEVGDLQRPRLIASDIDAEAGKSEQRQRLHEPSATRMKIAHGEVLVAVLDERKQHQVDLVQHQREQQAAAEDAEDFAARAVGGGVAPSAAIARKSNPQFAQLGCGARRARFCRILIGTFAELSLRGLTIADLRPRMNRGRTRAGGFYRGRL